MVTLGPLPDATTQEDMMTTTDTRFAACAITVEGYGDLQIIVYRSPADLYWQWQEEATRSGPQAEGYDPDAVLTDLGYERIGEWTLTDWGAVCDVVAR